jgi:hypothetical protein
MKRTARLAVGVALALPWATGATENLPHLPFGQTVELPQPRQWIVTPWYTYNYWKAFWKNGSSVDIQRVPEDGYDHNTGMLSVQYGLSRRLALDLTVGFTSGATRFFDPDRDPHTTMGLMDTQFGLRYQVLSERSAWRFDEGKKSWHPNLTLRLGGIIEGTYDADFPFAPGDGGSGLEPSVGFTKELFDFGLGLYGLAGWRIRNHGLPQTLFAHVGASQLFKFDRRVRSVKLNFGYMHLQDLDGSDVEGVAKPAPAGIFYEPGVKEVIRGIEGGVGITFRNGWLLQYYMEYSMDGRNTPQKTLYGLYMSIPIGGR